MAGHTHAVEDVPSAVHFARGFGQLSIENGTATDYDVNVARRTLDLWISLEHPLAPRVAAKSMCGPPLSELLKGGWEIRIFRPGSNQPAVTCRLDEEGQPE